MFVKLRRGNQSLALFKLGSGVGHQRSLPSSHQRSLPYGSLGLVTNIVNYLQKTYCKFNVSPCNYNINEVYVIENLDNQKEEEIPSSLQLCSTVVAPGSSDCSVDKFPHKTSPKPVRPSLRESDMSNNESNSYSKSISHCYWFPSKTTATATGEQWVDPRFHSFLTIESHTILDFPQKMNLEKCQIVFLAVLDQ